MNIFDVPPVKDPKTPVKAPPRHNLQLNIDQFTPD